MTNTHISERTKNYADGILKIARAEGVQNELEQQLKDFLAILRQNQELTTVLADSDIDIDRRIGVIRDLFTDQVQPLTITLLALVITAGRGNELTEIIDTLINRAAAGRNRRVARVRSASPLNDEQQARLAEALKESLGFEVEIHVLIDPSVIGGVVTEIGDRIIDGSIRNRLQQMRGSVH